AAGYAGTPAELRSAGSRVARSAKVQRFMELAAQEGGLLPDQPMSLDERKKVLARVARGADKSAAIRAIEVQHRISESENAAAEGKIEVADPVAVLGEIAACCPKLAAHLAQRDGIDWVPPAHLKQGTDCAAAGCLKEENQ